MSDNPLRAAVFSDSYTQYFHLSPGTQQDSEAHGSLWNLPYQAAYKLKA
jgi:hypothetical protein